MPSSDFQTYAPGKAAGSCRAVLSVAEAPLEISDTSLELAPVRIESACCAAGFNAAADQRTEELPGGSVRVSARPARLAPARSHEAEFRASADDTWGTGWISVAGLVLSAALIIAICYLL